MNIVVRPSPILGLTQPTRTGLDPFSNRGKVTQNRELGLLSNNKYRFQAYFSSLKLHKKDIREWYNPQVNYYILKIYKKWVRIGTIPSYFRLGLPQTVVRGGLTQPSDTVLGLGQTHP